MTKITDTDRLSWLLGYIAVDDVGGDELAWGVIVNDGRIAEDIVNQGFYESIDRDFEELCRGVISYPGKDGWQKRCILAGIDHAIREERKNDS